MKITKVKLGILSVPLRVPFKTALRSVSSVEDVIVEIHTDTGAIGYGEAPPPVPSPATPPGHPGRSGTTSSRPLWAGR